MTEIKTEKAPAAVGPYSQARKVGDLLFVSGQLPIDPATAKFVSDDAVAQIRQCLENIAAIAEAAGTSLSNTVKTTILVTNLGGFSDLNAAYAAFFSAPFPARATFEVSALPMGAKVEVEALISLGGRA